MTDPKHTAADEADVVRAEIEQTRAELAETVDALSDKLDVKQHVADKAAGVKQTVGGAVAHAKQAAPEPVQRALDVAGAKARPHRGKIVAGLVAAAAVLVVVRRVRADR